MVVLNHMQLLHNPVNTPLKHAPQHMLQQMSAVSDAASG